MITFVSRTVMNRLVGDYSFDEVIGPKRSDIANEGRGYPAHSRQVPLRHHHHGPPDATGHSADRVKPAFDKVNAAIQEKQKLENEAESERNKLLPEAKASRDKLIREAEGYAARRQAERRARSRLFWSSIRPIKEPPRSPASGSTSKPCKICS